MTGGARRVWLALLAILVLPGILGIATTSDEPSPETLQPGEATVLAWLRDNADDAIRASEGSGLPPEELVGVTWMGPFRLATWTEDYLAGVPGAEPALSTDTWFAPLVLDGRAAGVLETRFADGTVTLHREWWDPDVGAALLRHPADQFVLEGEDIVFRLSGSIVTPVNDESRELLAGRISAEDFQPFVVARLNPETDPESETVPSVELAPVYGAAIVLGGILVFVGLLRWSRRPEGM